GGGGGGGGAAKPPPRPGGGAARKQPVVLWGVGSMVVPGPEEVGWAEEALAWVLWALFAYAKEIGLNPPPFW
ncbi:MAG: hypothetical protein NZ821_09810, partial [Gloeomargarita sp. SKYB31]|nr:hypothetical protein [Gloeomargarita sp. SKYB31]